MSSPHVAALWGPWQPTQLRGAADKSGGKGLRKSGRGNERWEERGVLLFGQDGVCVHVCVCVHAIKRVTIAELCSRTSWSSIRRAPSEQMSNVQEKARSSSAPMVQH